MTDFEIVTEFKTVRVTYTITTMLGEEFTHIQDFVSGGWIMGSVPSNIKERFFKDGYYEPGVNGTLHKVAKVSMMEEILP
jgi:hypothetical protein